MPEMVETSSVVPSGAARATRPVPSVAPAPGLFSTMTTVPRRRPISSAINRAMISVVPPVAKGTISRTGPG